MGIANQDLGASRREERTVGAFDHVRLDGVGHVDVRIGDADQVSVEAPERLLDRIETFVEGRTLILRLRSSGSSLHLHGRAIRYEVTMPRIRGLAIDGSGSIDAPHVTSESFDASIDGAGHIDMGTADVQRLALDIDGSGRLSMASATANDARFTIDGAGTIEVDHLASRETRISIDGQGRVKAKGATDSLAIEIDGAGTVEACGLQARTADVSIDGVGEVSTWAEESLEACIDGFGRIEYVGNPCVRQRIDGAGRVARSGDRRDAQQPV
jgi:hypothetical protein